MEESRSWKIYKEIKQTVKRISYDFNLEIVVFQKMCGWKIFKFFDLLFFRKCVSKFLHHFLKIKQRRKKIKGLGNLKVFIVFEGTFKRETKNFTEICQKIA